MPRGVSKQTKIVWFCADARQQENIVMDSSAVQLTGIRKSEAKYSGSWLERKYMDTKMHRDPFTKINAYEMQD